MSGLWCNISTPRGSEGTWSRGTLSTEVVVFFMEGTTLICQRQQTPLNVLTVLAPTLWCMSNPACASADVHAFKRVCGSHFSQCSAKCGRWRQLWTDTHGGRVQEDAGSHHIPPAGALIIEVGTSWCPSDRTRFERGRCNTTSPRASGEVGVRERRTVGVSSDVLALTNPSPMVV